MFMLLRVSRVKVVVFFYSNRELAANCILINYYLADLFMVVAVVITTLDETDARPWPRMTSRTRATFSHYCRVTFLILLRNITSVTASKTNSIFWLLVAQVK